MWRNKMTVQTSLSQAVVFRFPTAEARLNPRLVRVGFLSPSTFCFLLSHYSTNAPYSLVCHRRCIFWQVTVSLNNALKIRFRVFKNCEVVISAGCEPVVIMVDIMFIHKFIQGVSLSDYYIFFFVDGTTVQCDLSRP